MAIEIDQVYVSKIDKDLLVQVIKIEQNKILWKDCSIKPVLNGTYWTCTDLFINSMKIKEV